MGEETSLSLEETNAIRRSLGLKPIPINPKESGQAEVDQITERKTESKDEQVNQERELNTHHFVDRDKIDLLRKRLQSIRGKSSVPSIERANEEDEEDWLSGIKDKKASGWKVRLTYDDNLDGTEERDLVNNDDIHIMQVENFEAIKPGEKVILTLGDNAETGQDDEDDKSEKDILVNEQLKHGMETARALSLRRMNQNRKRGRFHLNPALAKGEDDYNVKSGEKLSDIVVGAITTVNQAVIPANDADKPDVNKLSVKFEEVLSGEESDCGDFKKVKIKKRKMRMKSRDSLQKKSDVQMPAKIEQVKLDYDEDNEKDDENWVYEKLSRVKRPPNELRILPTPLEIAESVRKEQEEQRKRKEELIKLQERRDKIIIDESRTFFDSLKSELLGSTNPMESESAGSENVTTVDVNIPLDQIKTLEELPETETPSKEAEVQEPLNFTRGLASTLQFLREQHVLPKNNDEQLRDERLSHEQQIELQKLRDSMKDTSNTDKAKSEAERRNLERRLKEIQKERLKDYNPTVDLVYKNAEGNELTTKEAWKALSQKFHEFKGKRRKQAPRNHIQKTHKRTEKRN